MKRNRTGLTPLLYSLALSCFLVLLGCGGGGGAGATSGGSGSLPSVVTVSAADVGVDTATLRGDVNPNGLATDVWFEYGTSSTLATYDSTPHQMAGTGTATQTVVAVMTGWSPGTTYYFRVAATNVLGTVRGSIDRTPMIGPPVS